MANDVTPSTQLPLRYPDLKPFLRQVKAHFDLPEHYTPLLRELLYQDGRIPPCPHCGSQNVASHPEYGFMCRDANIPHPRTEQRFYGMHAGPLFPGGPGRAGFWAAFLYLRALFQDLPLADMAEVWEVPQTEFREAYEKVTKWMKKQAALAQPTRATAVIEAEVVEVDDGKDARETTSRY